jgi:hypothetical protein
LGFQPNRASSRRRNPAHVDPSALVGAAAALSVSCRRISAAFERSQTLPEYRVEFEDGRSGRWICDEKRFASASAADAYAINEYGASHARRKAGQSKDYWESYDVMCASCSRSVSDCITYPREGCAERSTMEPIGHQKRNPIREWQPY